MYFKFEKGNTGNSMLNWILKLKTAITHASVQKQLYHEDVKVLNEIFFLQHSLLHFSKVPTQKRNLYKLASWISTYN